MISDNIDLLRRIKESIDKGQTLKLKVRDNAGISTEQYRLRRVLAATDNHPTALGGEFSRLGSRVTLKLDPVAGYILAAPRSGASLSLDEYRATERDALEFLREAKGSMTVLEFFPSEEFDEDSFSRAAKEIGWAPHFQAASKEEEGKISLPAERIEADSSFSIERFFDD